MLAVVFITVATVVVNNSTLLEDGHDVSASFSASACSRKGWAKEKEYY